MRTRLRLPAVGLGALLLVTLLASPGLAWHSEVTVTARCLDGQVRVHYTVRAWEPDHEATVDVSYELDGEVVELEPGYFAPHHNQFSGHFDLPAGTTGRITFTAVAHWRSEQPSTNQGSDELPPADKCEEGSPAPLPTPTPPPNVAPTSSPAPPATDDTAVGAATSTTGGGQLPFTGASSVPMLLAGIVLVGGGALILLVSRTRGRQEAR